MYFIRLLKLKICFKIIKLLKQFYKILKILRKFNKLILSKICDIIVKVLNKISIL